MTTRPRNVSGIVSPLAAGNPVSSSIPGLAVLQPVEAQRVAARRDDAVERRFAAHERAVDRPPGAIFLIGQAGARAVGLGLI
jgi:hypothetical protein